MVCHGELVRLKPHPRYLTGFYVTVSLGGAMGGLFVGLVAPNLFRAYYEFPIGLGLCAPSPSWCWRGDCGASPGVPLDAPRCAAALAVVLCGYLACLGVVMREMVDGYRVVARNFYGLLRVQDEGNPGWTKMPAGS